MGYYIGHMVKKVKETSVHKYLLKCAKLENEGYEQFKTSVTYKWPKFWQKIYKAEYRKYYVLDDSRIAYFPKKQIDYIVTGDLTKL